jgi:hypothetical protein
MKIIDFFKRLFKRKQELIPIQEKYPEAKVITITRPQSRTIYDLDKGIITKSFKPRSAYQKRLWNNNKRLPKHLKDDDEDK